jgi:glycosyltransferase involved in cell wall biosynthesis
MIPSYNSGDYLRRTIESVLAQDEGPERMQIAVVDGHSHESPEALVRAIGADRVEFHRLDSNRGSAWTFNACIELARGHWLHILHGDDLVRPTFYRAYEAAIAAHPEVRMVVGPVASIDDHDGVLCEDYDGVKFTDGVMPDYLQRMATRIIVQCPAVVARRTSYEEAGGFCPLFHIADDWDMWFRLGQTGPVASVGGSHALYRLHVESDTVRKGASGRLLGESYGLIQLNLRRLRPDVQPEPGWRQHWASYATDAAWKFAEAGSALGRYTHAYWAFRFDPTAARAAMLVKSWLKRRFAR